MSWRRTCPAMRPLLCCLLFSLLSFIHHSLLPSPSLLISPPISHLPSSFTLSSSPIPSQPCVCSPLLFCFLFIFLHSSFYPTFTSHPFFISYFPSFSTVSSSASLLSLTRLPFLSHLPLTPYSIICYLSYYLLYFPFSLGLFFDCLPTFHFFVSLILCFSFLFSLSILSPFSESLHS